MTYQKVEPQRYGDWLQTYTGKAFWPMDPRADEVDIVDIAHALSQLCRYGGHSRRFYSVAEHSVLVSQIVPPEAALQALLHDATEAYLIDVPRPIKRHLGNYEQIETALALVIGEHFGVPLAGLSAAVKKADNDILLAERWQVMSKLPRDSAITGDEPAVDIRCYLPEVAEAFFLNRYRELTNG